MSLKKYLAAGLAVLALTSIVNEPVYAASQRGASYHAQINNYYSWLVRLFWSWTGHRHDKGCGHGATRKPEPGTSPAPSPTPGPVASAQVPELDGSAAAISLLLLGGLIVLRRETRRAV